MLFRKFELILIKFGFFTNFLSCSKIWSKTLYYRPSARDVTIIGGTRSSHTECQHAHSCAVWASVVVQCTVLTDSLKAVVFTSIVFLPILIGGIFG